MKAACENFWNWLTFSRMTPLLRLGRRRPITHEDLVPVDADLEIDNLYDEFMLIFAKRKTARKAFYCMFRNTFWLGLFFYAWSPIALFFAPIFLGKLIDTIPLGGLDSSNDPPSNPELRWLWAVLMSLTQFVSLLALSMSDHVTVRGALKARTIMSIAVCKMSVLRHAHHLVSINSVNLITQDSQRLVEFSVWMFRCLMAPIQILAGTIYVYYLVGWPVFSGVACMVLFLPVASWMGRKVFELNMRRMTKSDARIGYVNEILQAMKVIKSNAWDDACLDRVHLLRRNELPQLLRFRVLQAFSIPLSLTVPTVATILVFLTLYLSSDAKKFTATIVFQVATVFVTIRHPFAVLPVGLSLGGQVLASLQRFDIFLRLEQKKDAATSYANIRKKTTYKWDKIAKTKEGFPFTLEVPDIIIPSGCLLAVVGAVGSGKTAFLKSLLGEMAPSDPLKERIGYCTQTPFLLHCSLQSNILGIEKFDTDRYEDICTRCQLLADFDQLPDGDLTEIGERGINLSGGQKARIAIARAVYSSSDILLLDDVLAALDGCVVSSIISDVLLADKRTRIVVSVNIDVAKVADLVIFIVDGKALPPAPFPELMDSSSAFKAFAENSGMSAKMSMDGFIDDRVQKVTEDPTRDVEGVTPTTATMCKTQQNLPMQYSKVIKVLRTASNVGKPENGVRLNLKSERSLLCKKSTFIEQENVERGSVAFSVYKDYFAAGTYSSVVLFCALVLTAILAECSYIALDLWLAQWTNDEFAWGVDSSRYLDIYVAVAGGYFFLQLARSLAFTFFGYRAAVVLHTRMMRGVVESPMQFFNTTPSGRILNRVSKDVADVDCMLADKWHYLAMTLLRVICCLVVMGVAVPVSAPATLPFIVLYYYMLKYYRYSSRELQRLENTSRSPVVSAFTEAVHGLSTVRAFRWEEHMVEQFKEHLTRNIRAFYVMRMIELWFMQRLTLLGAIIVLCGSLGIAGTYKNISQGMAGVALTISLNIVMNLSLSVRCFAEMEAQMNSVERMLEYSKLPAEDEYEDRFGGNANATGARLIPTDPGKKQMVPKKKRPSIKNDVPFDPSAGAITFINVTVAYRRDLEPALLNVSRDIPAGSLVGICGRTGAGKSTLFLALLRLVPWRGDIIVDGINISTVPVKKLRRAITTVPQDPVLFSGTLRQNVDINGEHSDEAICAALNKAHFEKFAGSGPLGLDADVRSGGTNWSCGEKQIICFARAMLQQNRILLFDEATSFMDGGTDNLIQSTLRGALKHTTRLIIAHRLETINDADQFIVIDQGRLVDL